MNLVAQILVTAKALFLRALATIRLILITETGNPICSWEPLPHEPNMYDSGLVVAMLTSYMLLIPFFAVMACLISHVASHAEAYLYWEYRTYKRWFTDSERRLTPKEQLRVVEALCPDVEVRMRKPGLNSWKDKDEKYGEV